MPEPRSFAFNSSPGASPTCTGLGTRLVAVVALVAPDPSLSLADGALAPWSKSNFFYPELLEAVAKHFKIDMNKPWGKLSAEHRRVLLEGTGRDKIRFTYTNQYRHKRGY